MPGDRHGADPQRRRQTGDLPPKKKRSSGGHPSQGAPTVGGGTKTRPRVYRSPTPDPPSSSGGHPSRGGTTVGGGTKSKPKRYKTPTKSIRVQRRAARERKRDQETLRALTRLGLLNDPRKRLTSDPAKLADLMGDSGVSNKYPVRRGRLEPRDRRLAPTQVAGLNLDAAVSDLDRRVFPAGNPGLRVAKMPFQIGRATVEDPKGVAEGTAMGLKDTITGLPSALVKTATDPEGALKDTVKDYKRRYGPLLEGDERKFRERIKKEGALSETLDVAGVGAVGGRLVGLGRNALRTPKPRPKLKTSGGKAKQQRVSPNVFVEAAQRVQDRARANVTRRRVRRATQTGGRVDALDASVRAGEVAPIVRKRRQRIEPAQRKSRGVQALKGEQAREVHRGATKNIARLSKRERLGFKYALQLGIRDAKTARRVLGKRRRDIVAARETEGTVIPAALARTNDELRVIDQILEAPEKVFTERLAEVVAVERGREVRVTSTDPGLASSQRLLRRHAPLAEHLGLTRGEGEGAAAFVRRVKSKAKEEGLTDPAYFPSQKRPTVRYSDYALGGTKAVTGDKTYTGALFRTGREDTRPEAFTQSLAKNIKRKHNWNTVADNFDEHSFSWGRNKTVGSLLDELDRRNIDPGSVAFWNPRTYREARTNLERRDPNEEVFGDDIVPPGLTDAVREASVDAERLATKGQDFRNTSGWSVVPKAVYDEIHADTKPSGAVGRSFDVVKGKQSRILLGTNPPWLAFQAVSNVLLTGLAKTGPIDAVKAQLWWRKLDDKAKAEVEPYVGVGPFAVDVQQTKLGASTNRRMVNAYRAFKQTPMMQRVGKANPLDVLFRADNAQNNFFRRSVLYSQAKRDAYRRLGQDVGHVAASQERLKGLFTLGPKDQIARVIKDKDAIEQHATYVNDMLGDYATYTARERRTLGRAVMFYGFLRYSLHFTFWTMPTKHPVMSALVGNLARLQTQEVKELLGGDELPFALGRLYITKDGKLQAIELGRANPATNTITGLVTPYDGGLQFSPRGAFSLLPPMVVSAIEQGAGVSMFTGKGITVKGETSYGPFERQGIGKEIGVEERARLAANDFLSLFYPYRTATDIEEKGQPHSDDTLLWDPRKVTYKDEKIKRSLAKERRRQEGRDPVDKILEELTPFLLHPTRDREIAERVRERRNPDEKDSKNEKKKEGSWVDQYGGGGTTTRKRPKRSSGSGAASWVDKYGG